MTDSIIPQVTPNSTALSAEHYQTFDMAKANDGIIGGDDIARIRDYAAFVRAKAQSIHKTIAATNSIDDVVTVKKDMTESEQTFAKIGIYCDQRIGEILRELPTKQGARNDITSVGTPTKVEAEKQAGVGHATAMDLQKLAANPEVVEAVIAKATEEGRIVSRKQVLDAIAEKKRAERELRQASIEITDAKMEAESLKKQVSDARAEIAALERQNDELYAQKNPEPEEVERKVEVVREVVPEDYEQLKRDVDALRHETQVINESYQKVWREKMELDKKLAQANELLGEKGRNHEATRDIEHLTVATNSYLRNYGGKAWAFDQYERVDETTQREFERAITSLAAFAQNLAQMIQDKKQLGEGK